MKVVVLADTHTHGLSRNLPPSAWPYIETADYILHAGDVNEPALLQELTAFAPVTVVMGNTDAWDVREWGATDTAEVELDGIKIAMIHDSGVREGRRARMRKLFPDARVSSSSATRISPGTKTRTACCSSIRAARPGNAGPPFPPWASSGSRTAK